MNEKILKPSEVDKMVRNRTGGAAFPTYLGNRDNWDLGMTLRDYFAAQAIPALLTSDRWMGTIGVAAEQSGVDLGLAIAEQAYWVADAMIEARKK